MEFVRFGGLSPVKYREGAFPEFHNPPVKRGIYAFIWPYIENFLWVWKIKRRENETEEEWSRRKKLYHINNRRRFTYNGMIWCHFVDEAKAAKTKGSWVKVHTDELKDLLRKVRHNDIKHCHELGTEYNLDVDMVPPLNPYKKGLNKFICCSRDHLEVFIERVK